MAGVPDRVAQVRLVLVTDRRVMATETPAAFAAAIDRALAGVPVGSALVQVREKDLDGGALLALATAARRVAHARGALLLVNDRVDVALAAGADGAHLPETGLDLATAADLATRLRDLDLPEFIIGASRHNPVGAASASLAGAHLVHLGPIWPTPSKPNTPLGPAALTASGADITIACLVAVGGIDSPVRVREARAAGANAVAVVRAVWTAADPAAAAAALVAAFG